METAVQVEPIKDTTFGAWVRGVDVRELDEDTFTTIYDAWITFGLLIFPDQFLSKDEQDTFARRFGELEFSAAAISNITSDGMVHSADDDDLVKSLKGNQAWHFDSTYMPVQAKGAVFTAEIVPEGGGDTAWTDARAAYDVLDDETKQLLEGKHAYHSLYYSMGRSNLLPTLKDDGTYGMYGYHDMDVSLRPLTKVHPVTGRTNLLLGRHAHNIIGMSESESTELIDRINAAAAQPPRTYQHQWTEGEAVLWDNRCIMHRGVPWKMDEPRRMWHTRIAGDPATESAVNHASAELSPQAEAMKAQLFD
ncbi:MAG: TauD/TfdA family dioxygenase [Acidimicrobiaceae bacterium]|mgnify:FL=1|nr:TauD/TfdA family dioxygenase [Acidimicrobiaceae bacterium]MCO4832932.1 TauD/TfdA family dioxygenase [Acidimicrobiaceae bacterium]MDC1388224.1 TauD/TfdA family dioxygenase [Acidimicrobiales bacterium]HAY69944.1 TauD/TfdA family dioxygenase [Acidimicrobiaceae bacterium]